MTTPRAHVWTLAVALAILALAVALLGRR